MHRLRTIFGKPPAFILIIIGIFVLSLPALSPILAAAFNGSTPTATVATDAPTLTPTPEGGDFTFPPQHIKPTPVLIHPAPSAQPNNTFHENIRPSTPIQGKPVHQAQVIHQSAQTHTAVPYQRTVPAQSKAQSTSPSTKAVAPKSSAIRPASGGTGTISGYVYDGGGTPIVGMNVSINGNAYSQGTCTDNSGYYSVDIVPYDTPVTIQAGGDNSCPGGSQDYAVQYWDHTLNSSAPTLVTLSSITQSVSNVNFSLSLGGTVTGTVTDADSSQPLGNMSVSVNFGGWGGWGIGGCTDSNGIYTISHVPFDIQFRVVHFGATCDNQPSGHAQRLYNGTPDWGSATLLTLSNATPTLDHIDLSLSPGGYITGRVVDAANSSQSMANIALNVDFGSWSMGGCTSDSSGDFTIYGISLDIPFRVYNNGIDCNGQPINYFQQFWQYKSDWNSADLITLTSGALSHDNVNFSLSLGGTVTGTVSDQNGTPLANIHVDVGWGNGGCTDSSGTYTVSGLPLNQPFAINAGDWFCGNPQTPSGYARQFWNHTPSDNGATKLTITTSGQTISHIDFTLDPGGTVSGQVLDEQGAPIVNMIVSAEFDGWATGSCTDGSGNYILYGLPYGLSFRVRANGGNNWCNGNGPQNYQQQFWNHASDSNGSQALTLSAQQPSYQTINFTLSLGGTVTGTVTARNGGASLANIHVYANGNGWWVDSCTDSNGNYTLSGLTTGQPFQVGSGDNICGGGPSGYAQQYWQDTNNQNSATSLTVNPGDTLPNINFNLDLGGSVSGHVTDNHGVPLGGMTVNADFNGWSMGTCTDGNGDYTLSAIPYGIPFRVDAPAGGSWNWCNGTQQTYMQQYWDHTPNWDAATTLTLSTQQQSYANINFSLPLGGSVSGKVTDQNGIPLANISVNIWGENGGPSGCTDSNGNYTLSAIPVNQPFRVEAGDWFCGNPQTPSGYAQQFWNHTPNNNATTYLTITTSGQTLSGIDFTLDPGGTVSGQVLDDHGAPIANMLVNPEFDGWANGNCTDSSGNYTLFGLPYGLPFRVKATSGGSNWCNNGNGPQIYQEQYWDHTSDWNAATVLTLSDQQQSYANINFSLTLGGSISGKITNQSGTPLANVNVNIWANGWGNGTCTDNNGNYTFWGLPTGKPFTVEAGDWLCGNLQGPSGYARQFWNHTPSDNAATILTIAAGGQTINGIDFTLDPGGSVSGQVLDDQGAPIVNMIVVAEFDGWGNGSCTDSNGIYTVVGLPYGMPFRVEATNRGDNWCNSGNGPKNYREQFWSHTSDWNVAQVLTLGVQQPSITGINFNLTLGGTISGHVTTWDNQTLANLDVNIDNHNGWGTDSCTDNSGNYTVHGVQTGQPVYVTIGWWGCGAGGLFPYAQQFWQNTTDQGSATPLTLISGQTVSGIDFTLQAGGSVSGHVTDLSGKPLANINMGSNLFWLGACTDSNGNYTINGFPYDTPFKLIAANGWNWCANAPNKYSQVFWPGTPNPNKATSLTVNAATPNLPGMNFKLGLGGIVKGQVKTTGGQPVANIRVGLWKDFDGGSTCTDANGNYEVDAIPSGVGFKVYANGDQDCSGNPLNNTKMFWQNTQNWVTAKVITLSAGQTMSGINFTLGSAGYVMGRVTDTVGNPLGQIQVELIGDTTLIYGWCTSDDGTYTIVGVPLNKPFKVQAGDYPADECPGPRYNIQYWNHTANPNTASLVQLSSQGQTVGGIDFSLTMKAFTPTPTFTRTPTVTRTPTITRTPTVTRTPTITRTVTNTRTPTLTRTVTRTFTPSKTATTTRTPTVTRTPTITRTVTVTRTPTTTRTATKTFTPSNTSLPSKTATNTRTPTITRTVTITRTPTRTPTPNSKVVTNANDSGTGSLRDALNTAPNNTVVTFSPTFFNTPKVITLTSGPLLINRNITIQGLGASLITVDGAQVNSVFAIAYGGSYIAKNVTISGLTMQHSLIDTIDGGVAGGLTINDSVLFGSAGSALVNHQSTSTVTLNNCYVLNNSGGGIFNFGTLIVNNSHFTGNTGKSGIVNDLSSASLTVSGSDFSGNTTDSGGGIYNHLGTAMVSSSSFTSNTVSNAGAGIFNDGTLSINTSNFSGNSTGIDGHGGGIANQGTATITNSTFTSNWALGANSSGGGIDNYHGTLTASNSTLYNNSSAYGGGINSNSSAATISNSTVADNAASFGGGINNGPDSTLNLGSVIVADNPGSIGPDINGMVTSLGNNLISDTTGTTATWQSSDQTGVDPLLNPLALNLPGTIQTMSLQTSSPAIGAGICDWSGATVTPVPPSVTTDQRGQPRKNPCDVGAFETTPSVGSVAPAPTERLAPTFAPAKN